MRKDDSGGLEVASGSATIISRESFGKRKERIKNVQPPPPTSSSPRPRFSSSDLLSREMSFASVFPLTLSYRVGRDRNVRRVRVSNEVVADIFPDLARLRSRWQPLPSNPRHFDVAHIKR